MRAGIFLVTGVLVSSLASAQEAGRAPRLLTTGSATVSVPADHARLTIACRAKALKAKDAMAKLSTPMNAIRDAVLALGVPRSSIASAGSSLARLDDMTASTTRGYSASSSVSVELSELAQLGSVVDAVIAAGASDIAEIAFLPKDPEVARGRALGMAFQQARRDAEALAVAAGSSLGRLVSVVSDRSLGNAVERDATLGTSYLLAPEVTIAVTVRVEWELESASKARRP